MSKRKFIKSPQAVVKISKILKNLANGDDVYKIMHAVCTLNGTLYVEENS